MIPSSHATPDDALVKESNGLAVESGKVHAVS